MRLAFLLLLPICMFLQPGKAVQAQWAQVRGRVIDVQTGRGLAGAHVQLVGNDGRRGTATDEQGRFSFVQVMPGIYRIRVSYVGYASFEDTLQLSFGQVVEREITLHPVVVETPVVHVASTAHTELSRPGELHVRSVELLRVPAPDLSADLASYLSTQPGFLSAGEKGGQFFVRGGTPVQNLMLVDGVVVYQPFHMVGFYSVIPAEMLNEAEVYAGGFPARYGARLSSVVDVRLRHGNKQHYAGSLTFSPVLSGFSVEGPVLPKTSSFIVSLRHSMLEKSSPWLTGRVLPYRFGDALLKFHSYLNATSSFQATALYAFDEGNFSDERRDIDRIAWQNLAVGLTYWYLPPQYPAFFSARVSLSMLTNRLGVESLPYHRSQVAEFSGEMTYGYLLGDWKVQFALFAIGRSFCFKTSARPFPEHEFLNEGGIYVESHLPLSQDLRLEPGLRLHGFPSRGTLTIAPRLRLTGEVGKSHRFMLAYGIYHQPLVAAYDDRDATQAFVTWLPSPEHQPVPTAAHYLAGWQTRLSRRYQLQMEVYHKALRNMAFVAGNVGVQVRRGQSTGLDLKLEYHQGKRYGYLGYSLGRTRYYTAAGVLSPPHDRRHQVHLLVQQTWGGLQLRLHWQLGSGFPFTPVRGFYDTLSLTEANAEHLLQEPTTRLLYGALYSRRLPPYHRLDVTAAYEVHWQGLEVHLALSIVNVYNRKNLFYYNAWENQRVYHFPMLPSISMQVRF